MGKFVVEGGYKLCGEIEAERAKNAVLPILAASVLTREETVIKDCPRLSDVSVMIQILHFVGCKTHYEGRDLVVYSSNVSGYEVPADLAEKLRASVYFLGALLSRLKKVKLPRAGGCKIGSRPIDIHLDAFKKLGVRVSEEDGETVLEAEKIVGGKVRLRYPSVGATENILLLTAISDGVTLIFNAAKEPEVVDLAAFLNAMGAKILGAGTDVIMVEGVKKLTGVAYRPVGDRIEAGTYLLAALLTGGDVQIKGVEAKNLSPDLNKFLNNTCNMQAKGDIIRVKVGSITPFRLKTAPFPGFPTDLQSPMLTVATAANGVSVIRETVFETRFSNAAALVKMGANVRLVGDKAIVTGGRKLHGESVTANDLRSGAGLVLAGLIAEGETVVKNAGYIERGYFDFDGKLSRLGGRVKRYV